MKLNVHMLISSILICGLASAQTYPSKLIALVAPAVPSGGTDIRGRAIAEELGERIGQAATRENRLDANSHQHAT